MKTLTIRGVDPELTKAIKSEAQKNRESINQTALKILRRAMGLKNNPIFPTYNDLDALAGTWSEEDVKEFQKSTSDFNQIDESHWQ